MQEKGSANRLTQFHIIYESERREKKGPANRVTRFHISDMKVKEEEEKKKDQQID